MAIWLNHFEEIFKVIVADVLVMENLTLTIHDTDVHALGMKIDSTVEFSFRLM